MLSLSDLTIQFGSHKVLDKLNLDIQSGQLVAIVGPNGCGKSTLLKSIAKLVKPSSGSVSIDDTPIAMFNRKQFATKLAMLPQHPIAPAGITVRELVEFGRHPYKGVFSPWTDEDEQIVQRAMSGTFVCEFANKPLDQLSGGQWQRAWIAMILAQQTDIILLDEPTSALDIGHQLEVLELIKSLTEKGKTIIVVLHDLAVAARYADEVIAIKTGRLVAQGSPRSVVTEQLLASLYGIDVDIFESPNDGAPIIIAKRKPIDAMY